MMHPHSYALALCVVLGLAQSQNFEQHSDSDFTDAISAAYRRAVSDRGATNDAFLEVDCAFMDALLEHAYNNRLPSGRRSKFTMPPRVTHDSAGRITAFEDEVEVSGYVYRFQLTPSNAPQLFNVWKNWRTR